MTRCRYAEPFALLVPVLELPEARADPGLFIAALITAQMAASFVDMAVALQLGEQAVVLARRLGDDYQAVVRVSGAADREQERYPLLEERLELDLSGLSDDEKKRLLVVVNRAIDLVCTVGRTLKSGTTVNFEVAGVKS